MLRGLDGTGERVVARLPSRLRACEEGKRVKIARDTLSVHADHDFYVDGGQAGAILMDRNLNMVEVALALRIDLPTGKLSLPTDLCADTLPSARWTVVSMLEDEQGDYVYRGLVLFDSRDGRFYPLREGAWPRPLGPRRLDRLASKPAEARPRGNRSSPRRSRSGAAPGRRTNSTCR